MSAATPHLACSLDVRNAAASIQQTYYLCYHHRQRSLRSTSQADRVVPIASHKEGVHSLVHSLQAQRLIGRPLAGRREVLLLQMLSLSWVSVFVAYLFFLHE